MFKAKIANYFGTGSEVKHYQDGSWCLCLIKMKLGKYRVELEQNPSILWNAEQPQGFVETTCISVAGVKTFSEGQSVVLDICYLLSLASMSQVTPYHFEFRGSAKSLSAVGQSMRYRPLLEIHDGSVVKSYLEKVWPNYRKLKRSRKLPEVIDMLTTCELPGLPLEIQLGQMFVILENLKGTFAKYSGIPFVAGFFREISNPPKTNTKKEKQLSFNDLLTKMLAAEGMKPKLKRIIRLRNEIIHFGLSRKPYESLIKNYDYCHDVVREYLLRLLGYSGEYLVYSKACRTTLRL
ncbi:hypothetical protein [Halioxenophilus aromaticivorans]|uniref:hypothetical protein n=1 Tax=Halioxenophilus aromaticivorans TaxID=1306992 RepID=UPI0031EBD388